MTPQALLLGLSGGLFMLLSLSALVTVTLLEDFEADFDRVPIRFTHSRYPLYYSLNPSPQGKKGPVRGIYLSKILFDKLLDAPPSNQTSGKARDFSAQTESTLPLVLKGLLRTAQTFLVLTPSTKTPVAEHSLCQNPKDAVWTLGIIDTDSTKGRQTASSYSFTRFVRPADAFFASYDEADVTIEGDWTQCYKDNIDGEVQSSTQTPDGSWVAVAYGRPQLDGQSRQIFLRLYRFAVGSSNAPSVRDIILEGSQPVRALALQPLSSNFSHSFWEPLPVLRVFISREKDSRPFRTLEVFPSLEWRVAEPAMYASRKVLDLLPFHYAGEELLLAVQQLDRTAYSIDVFSLYPPSSMLSCPAHPLDTNHTETALWAVKLSLGKRAYSKQARFDESDWMMRVASSLSRECFVLASVPYVLGLDRDAESRLVEILHLPPHTYFRRVAISDDGNFIALLDNRNELLLLEREVPPLDPFDDEAQGQQITAGEPQRQWQVAMELPLSPPLRGLSVLHMQLTDVGRSRPALMLLLEGGVLACLDISPRYRPPEEDSPVGDFLDWVIV